MRAIEDVPASAGVMALPSGPPTVLGPANWNPFWSEGMRDEAILRAIRPADLPSVSTELVPGDTPVASPPREGPEAFKAIIQGLITENVFVWNERETWSSQASAWGQPPP